MSEVPELVRHPSTETRPKSPRRDRVADTLPSSNADCHYSYTAKLGKPKGSRNKKTLEKLGLLSSDAKNSSGAKPKTSSASSSSHNSKKRDRKEKQAHYQPQEYHDEPEIETALSYLDRSPSCELETAVNATSKSLASPSPMYDIPPPADDMGLSFFQSLADFEMPLFSPSTECQGLIHVSGGLQTPFHNQTNAVAQWLTDCGIAGIDKSTVGAGDLGDVLFSRPRIHAPPTVAIASRD